MPQIPNGIGDFIIGESAIGDQPFYWPNTVYSQYYNSPVIMAWLDYFSQWIDANANIDAWYDQLWNIETAVGYGLDVWGRILGVSRVLSVSETPYFSFANSGGDSNPTAWYTWYSGEALNSNYSLTDDAFRQLLFAKAAANIWDGSILGLNAILRMIFPDQVCYVTDGLDMTMTYTFAFQLSPVQSSIVFNSGVLPRPCGVAASVVQL